MPPKKLLSSKCIICLQKITTLPVLDSNSFLLCLDCIKLICQENGCLCHLNCPQHPFTESLHSDSDSDSSYAPIDLTQETQNDVY